MKFKKESKRKPFHIGFKSFGSFINKIESVKAKNDLELLLWMFEELGEVSRTLNRPERENSDSLLGEVTDFFTLFAAMCYRLNINLSDMITKYNVKAADKGREIYIPHKQEE